MTNTSATELLLYQVHFCHPGHEIKTIARTGDIYFLIIKSDVTWCMLVTKSIFLAWIWRASPVWSIQGCYLSTFPLQIPQSGVWRRHAVRTHTHTNISTYIYNCYDFLHMSSHAKNIRAMRCIFYSTTNGQSKWSPRSCRNWWHVYTMDACLVCCLPMYIISIPLMWSSILDDIFECPLNFSVQVLIAWLYRLSIVYATHRMIFFSKYSTQIYFVNFWFYCLEFDTEEHLPQYCYTPINLYNGPSYKIIGITIMKHLINIMGISIPTRRHLYIERSTPTNHVALIHIPMGSLPFSY